MEGERPVRSALRQKTHNESLNKNSLFVRQCRFILKGFFIFARQAFHLETLQRIPTSHLTHRTSQVRLTGLPLRYVLQGFSINIL